MTFRVFFRRAAAIVGLILFIAALWFLRDTLLLAFAAIVIAVGISIPSGWLQRLGLPRGVANTLAAVLIGFLALFLLVWLLPALITGVSKLLTGLPQTVQNLVAVYNDLRAQNDTLARILPAVQETRPQGVSEAEIRNLFNELVSTGLPILVSGGSVVVSLVTNLVLVLFIALLLLADPTAYVQASLYLAPRPYHERLIALWRELYHTLTTWLSTLFISISITVSLVWIILGLLGMPNVLVVAVFAGFATFIPNIGAFLPLVPIAIFTLAVDPIKFLVMAPAYLAIQLLESNVLSPMIVKRNLSIPPAGMLVFQIVAGLVFGLLGVLLAVPLLAIIVTLVRELYSYDLLGLRNAAVKVRLGRAGGLQLQPEPPKTVVVARKAEPQPSQEGGAPEGEVPQ